MLRLKRNLYTIRFKQFHSIQRHALVSFILIVGPVALLMSDFIYSTYTVERGDFGQFQSLSYFFYVLQWQFILLRDILLLMGMSRSYIRINLSQLLFHLDIFIKKTVCPKSPRDGVTLDSFSHVNYFPQIKQIRQNFMKPNLKTNILHVQINL